MVSVTSVTVSGKVSSVAEVRRETRDSVVRREGFVRVAFVVEVVLMTLSVGVDLAFGCDGTVYWVRGVELSDEDSLNVWKGLWKIVLADSDGVIVAVVIFEIIDLVSSSSSLSSGNGIEFVTAEMRGDFGGGCPLRSFYYQHLHSKRGKIQIQVLCVISNLRDSIHIPTHKSRQEYEYPQHSTFHNPPSSLQKKSLMSASYKEQFLPS